MHLAKWTVHLEREYKTLFELLTLEGKKKSENIK